MPRGPRPTRRALLLLTTTGAKSGEARTTPLVYSKDGAKVVIVASMGGHRGTPPGTQLSANPGVAVELGAEKFEATASATEGAERDRLYAKQAELMPAFTEYEQKTTRRIPVVLLERAGV